MADVPEEYYTARGVKSSDLVDTACMRVPTDPFMHLILYQWRNLTSGPAWPAPFNQVGSRGMSLLVDDVPRELERIRKEFPSIKILREPHTIRRKWGKTTTALFIDTEDIQVEVISLEKGSAYDLKKIIVPRFNDMQWLHFMLNCTNYDESMKFYQSFGMYHDSAVDFRPNVGFHPKGQEHYAQQWRDAFNFEQKDLTGVGFLRSDRDPSGMHLELMKYNLEAMTDPDDKPTWQQKGICRYCFRVEDYAASLEEQRARGARIYVEDQRGKTTLTGERMGTDKWHRMPRLG